MEYEERPDPDQLLRAIQRQEKVGIKGQLKVFLGMSAGVGKTYAMLESAQKLSQQGVKLVVGVVNTHGRQETAALLEGLTVIPLKKIDYKGIQFEELDIDEILRLKPQLVLVDELAHTNVPGSRHQKRWQDVVEILENGTDVHTTLNVQHIESLKDIVESITAIPIRETVPDAFIEAANQIELIDLTPNELLQRLKEGKVYLGEKSQLAIENFFKADRLTALREMALRYAAEKVDHDLQEMAPMVDREAAWKPRERILVAISPSPHSQKLIRATRRFAANLHCPWIALYVDSGRVLEESDNNMLAKNIALARDLGAEVLITHDPSIAEGVKRVARQRGVTQIILGRPPKSLLSTLFRRTSLVETLTLECSDIDIHVIRQERLVKKYRKKLIALPAFQSIYSYLSILIWVAIVSSINWILLSYIDYQVIAVIFLIASLATSFFFSRGPILLGAVLFAFIWGFFFIPSTGEVGLDSLEDIGLFLLFFLIAVTTGMLVNRALVHKEMLEKRERSIGTLYNIFRQIALSSTTNQIFATTKDHLEKILNGTVEIMIKNADGVLVFNKSSLLITNEKERSAATWVFESGKEAGWSTLTLPSSKNLYIPLKGMLGVVGVLIYRPKKQEFLPIEEKNILYTVCQQLAHLIERLFSDERGKEYEELKLIEDIYEKMLRKISIEFKKPLVEIETALSDLKNRYMWSLTKTGGYTEFKTIESASAKLLDYLNNMSTLVQLSEGLISVKKERYSVQKLIERCVKKIQDTTKREIKTNVPEKTVLAEIDVNLMQLLLSNLISSAIERTPEGSTIEVEAKIAGDFIVISILDEGDKMAEEMLMIMFEKAYRLPETTFPGMTVGLEIAKAIAKIHHGYLKAENRPYVGIKCSLYLPFQQFEKREAL